MKTLSALLRYPAAILLFTAGILLKNFSGDVPAAVLFFLLGGLLAVLIYKESENILDLRLLLTVSWFLCISLSCLKLSELQTEWGAIMWIAVGSFYFMFTAGYDLTGIFIRKRGEKKEVVQETGEAPSEVYMTHVFSAILIVALLGLSGFLLECLKFQFEIPLFVRGVPHSYTEFHITGVHYFVVSLMLVHPLSVIYLMQKKEGNRHLKLLIVLNLVCFAVPVLLLSKLQILIALAMPVTAWLLLQKRVPAKKLLFVVLLCTVTLLVTFILIVFSRDYPAGYLEMVFRFKKPETSLAIQYPFMYFVINFENLSRLVEKKAYLTLGTRQLYPFFCLTGLKFRPEIQVLIYREVHLASYQLTTRSLLYDAYGDFGIVGTMLLGILTGALSSLASFWAMLRKNVAGILLYGQLVVYMTLSFFTAWFSNPTTWFWLIATWGIGLFCNRKTLWFHKKEKSNGP